MISNFDNAMNSVKAEAIKSGRSEIDVLLESINVGVSYIKAKRETTDLNISSAAITVEEISFMTNLIKGETTTSEDESL